MRRETVAEAIKRRQAERIAADVQRRKALYATTSATGAIAMITMAAAACWG